MSQLLERLKSEGPKRILALDGGGIRGALTLGFLIKIEDTLRARHNDDPDFRLCDYFDLIGGTSTGSIIASGLAIGMSAREIQALYLKLGDRIFGKKYGFFTLLMKGKSFNAAPLKAELKAVFGDITMGSDAIKTGLCIIAKRADTYSTWPVINHPEAKFYSSNKDILLREMVRASTAAPTYFEPQMIDVGTKAKPQMASFVDGGVSMFNNPALQLFLVATLKGFPFNWETGGDKLSITSVGTGIYHPRFDAEDIMGQGLKGWAEQLPNLFMYDAMFMNQMILQYLSASPTSIKIDDEVGDLKDDLLHDRASIHYVRYDVELEQEAIAKIGIRVTEEEVISMREMSNAENVKKLTEIGVKAAETQVEMTHFPTIFDLS